MKLTTGIAIPGRSIIVSVHVVVVVAVVVVAAVLIVRFAHRVHAGKKFHNFLTVQHGHSTKFPRIAL